MENWQANIHKLESLLSARVDLKHALELSIAKADLPDIRTLDEYYKFLGDFLTEIPTRREMSPKADKFHHLVSLSPNGLLEKDEAFNGWRREFSQSLGSFLDTTGSAACLDTFISDPGYHIEDYDRGASGWLTFNQFFARKTKPGKRPVDGYCNDDIVVSAADSVYLGSWKIGDDSTIVAKGNSYFIGDLLHGSPYRDEFQGGMFTHSYLDSNDYHRFHVPVGGIIREARTIPGNVLVHTVRKQDGSLESQDGTGFQFTQTRGLLIIESKLGMVAAMPIGMGHVSSVNITAEPGIKLVKGEEFGYFCYGGSDMVMLFQAGKVNFTANPGMHYKQGRKIAEAIVSSI